MKKPETKREKRFFEECAILGLDAKKYRDPSRNGAPDRQVFTMRGISVFVELKEPGEERRIEQLIYAVWLLNRGYLCICHDGTKMSERDLAEHIKAFSLARLEARALAVVEMLRVTVKELEKKAYELE